MSGNYSGMTNLLEVLCQDLLPGVNGEVMKIKLLSGIMSKIGSLTVEDKNYLERRIAESEEHTGVQIVISVINRCDSYPEIPWKAFATGTSIAGFLVFAAILLYPFWPGKELVILAISLIMACGFLLLVAAVMSEKFSRILAGSARMKTESRQYARSLFLEQKLSATPDRKGMLIMTALFERQVVIIPDSGLEDRLDNATLQSVIGSMTTVLSGNDLKGAFDIGLNELVRILGSASLEPGLRGELPDQIIERKGE